MAVAMMVDNPHGSQEIYERVRELIGLERPAGGIFHLAGASPNGGWRVIEVWASEGGRAAILQGAAAAGRRGRRRGGASPAAGLARPQPHAVGLRERAAMSERLKLEERSRPPAGDDGARERLLAGLPVAERRLRLAGVSTAVLEGGDGPPLVLLHGGIECGGAYWAPVISRLAESHRLIVPDVPGLGESEPVARLDAVAFGDWFAELVRATCREQPMLVAHSLLGTLAARFAAEHGDLLGGLMIYATPGVGRYRMPLGFRVVAIRYGLRPTERNNERFERWAFFDLDRTRRCDPEWFEAFNAYALSLAVLPHVKRAMRQLIKTCTRKVPDVRLGRIEVPTALLWGRHDRMTPLDLAEAASVRLGWPLHVIDDAGHAPHIERPDAFVGALRTALDETAGGSQP
jgi:pimeloyl-ACP methyl ester carboxylesterase